MLRHSREYSSEKLRVTDLPRVNRGKATNYELIFISPVSFSVMACCTGFWCYNISVKKQLKVLCITVCCMHA